MIEKAGTPQYDSQLRNGNYSFTPNPTKSKVNRAPDTPPDYMRNSYSHPQDFPQRQSAQNRNNYLNSEEYKHYVESISQAFNEKIVDPDRVLSNRQKSKNNENRGHQQEAPLVNNHQSPAFRNKNQQEIEYENETSNNGKRTPEEHRQYHSTEPRGREFEATCK